MAIAAVVASVYGGKTGSRTAGPLLRTFLDDAIWRH